MRFGAVPVVESLGCVLAHSARLSAEKTLRKGHVIDALDIALLSASGQETVWAARLEPGDVAEDKAASTLARMLMGAGLRASRPTAGRCDLRATRAGLAQVDAGLITALNALSEEVTVATLEPQARVAVGSRVATIKIIPLAASESVLGRCAMVTHEGTPLSVRPFGRQRAGLVCTVLSGLDGASRARAIDVLRSRLHALDSELSLVLHCPHQVAEVSHAVARLAAEGCSPILIFGASAIVDRRDVVPAALTGLGARIERFGMPTEPGNLLLLAKLGSVPVIGVPGCGRSPKRSGFDAVLERIVAGLEVSALDLARMGVGGLLEERHENAATEERVPAREPGRVAGLVLAAGSSARMGPVNKLLAQVDGAPLVTRVVDQVLASGVSDVFVVTGHDAAAVRSALIDRPVVFLDNPMHAEGIASSLRSGITALGSRFAGAVVCLGDMPRVRAGHITRLLLAFRASSEQDVCLSVYRGRRGNPVLWPRRCFVDLLRLHGDVGGRTLLSEPLGVRPVAMDDDGVLTDVDTPEALAALV